MAEAEKIGMVVHMVVNSMDEKVLIQTEEQMKTVCPNLGFSPAREAPGLYDCLEVHGSAEVSPAQKEEVIRLWNNDWDRDEDDTWFRAYGFNTKMFNPDVYYLQLDFSR